MNEQAPADQSTAYRYYVLGALFSVYVINFVDRQIVSILLQDIKEEFILSDTQLGILAGFAFAVFHSIMAIVIARWADHANRRSILATAIAVWSIMTALCGFATNFVTLLLARMGVGIAEAGSAPPSHSLISDYFPPERRATALGIYTAGINVGILISMIVGGWVNQYFGWRMAFLVVGIPGLLMAVIVRFTIKEPPRGRFDPEPITADTHTRASLLTSVRELWSIPSFRHTCLGDGIFSIVLYAMLIWGPAHFIRVHQMQTGELGTWLALIIGIGGFAGTFGGGLFADYLIKKTGDRGMALRMTTVATACATPLFLAVVLVPSASIALMISCAGWVIGSMWPGPVYSVFQSLSRADTRALAAAIALFTVNIIGFGIGPLAVGMLSDALNPLYGDRSVGIALAIVIAVAGSWGVVHFAIGSKTLHQDIERVLNSGPHIQPLPTAVPAADGVPTH